MSAEQLNFEVIDSERPDGRVVLQMLSGEYTNRFKMESLGRLSIVRGRYKLFNGSSYIIQPFDFSLDCGKLYSVKHFRDDFSSVNLPPYIRPNYMTVIKASDFPISLPIESMRIEILNCNYKHCVVNTACPVPSEYFESRDSSANVCLMRATYVFRNVSSIRLEDKLSKNVDFRVTESMLDKITLVCFKVSIPRINSVRIEINDEVDSPRPPLLSLSSDSGDRLDRPLLSPTNRYELIQRHNVSSAYGSAGSGSRHSSWLPDRRLSIEIFVFFLVVLVWLIVRSHRQDHRHRYHDGVNADNEDSVFNFYSGIFLVVSFLIIFSVRGTALKTVLARFQSPECNGRSFFVNGWSAWSFCGSVLQGRTLPMYALPNVFVRAFHDGGVGSSLPINLGLGEVPYRTSKDSFRPSAYGCDYIASDMFTILGDMRSKYGVVLGFLSQKQHFGCIAVNRAYDRLSVHLSCDGVVVSEAKKMTTDWLALYTSRHSVDPFRTYLRLSGAENGVADRMRGRTGDDSAEQTRCSVATAGFASDSAATERAPPSGWCSWYQYFAGISERDLKKNLQCMAKVRSDAGLAANRGLFDLFQIDDGYQTAWGDWTSLNTRTFPSNSMEDLVRSIRGAGLTSGLWLAPFACDKHSLVAQQHPSWILKKNGSNGTIPSNSAHCGKWFYGLDVTNPEVQAHIASFLSVATRRWRFEYLKLDFLYAAVLSDCHESYFDRSLTKAQVLQVGLGLVDRAVTSTGWSSGGKEVYVVGCGAPLGATLGHVHANRISTDAGLTWLPSFPLPSTDKWNIPCARNMIRNTLTRLFMHGHWWTNDPDCLLLRDSLPFSETEIRAIATVKALCGGSMIVSDDLTRVSEQRLRLMMQVLPPTNVAAVAVDLLDRETPELLRLVLQSSRSASYSALDSLSSCAEQAYCDSSRSVVSSTADWEAVTAFDPEVDLFLSRAQHHRALSAELPPLSAVEEECASPRERRQQIDHLFSAVSRRERRVLTTAAPAVFRDPNSSKNKGTEIPRHVRSKSHVFTNESTEAMADRREKKHLLQLLEKERETLKQDLHGHWVMFAVCNWDEKSSAKSHFVSLRDIFGAEFIKHVLIRNRAFSSLLRAKSRRGTSGDGHDLSPLHNGNIVSAPSSNGSNNGSNPFSAFASLSVAKDGTNKTRDSPVLSFSSAGQSKFVMHLFDFWAEAYSSKVVCLSEGDCSEVAFPDIPRRGVSLLSVGLFTDPTLPKYVGSNLHFSCGTELTHCRMVSTPCDVSSALLTAFNSRLLQKYRQRRGHSGSNNSSFRSSSFRSGDDRMNGVRSSAGDQVPVLRSVSVGFKEGSLRDHRSFKGFVWLYLPLNPMNRGLDASFLVDNIQVSSSAAVFGSDGRPAVELVSYICEKDCKAHGAVFKIAVCSSRVKKDATQLLCEPRGNKSVSSLTEESISADNSFRLQDSSATHGASFSARRNGTSTLRIDTALDLSEAKKDDGGGSLVVSWIMDMAEVAAPPLRKQL